MEGLNALLLSDGYKQVHAEQFPKGTTKLVSYMTPRKSRLNEKELIFFGLQGFCKEYLIDYFNENFFLVPKDIVIEEYTRILDVMMGKGNYGVEKIAKLHDLGYLPLEIWSVPEGSKVPMGVPCIEITNTHDDFAWVVQWVESLLSSEIWKPCVHAGVGYSYRKIVDKWYDKTVDDEVPHNRAISDFGFRGMSCSQEATHASAAWLLSFLGTATIPAVPYLEEYYNCDCTKEPVGYSAVSTEHSVVASNFAVDGDEITLLRRMLTEIYPNTSFSFVSDTYDYWNLVKNILPQLKDEIMSHNGKLLVRPDSGDIVEISVNTIKALWDIFGGKTNSKGYNVLDPHIGCIYGDGVTQKRAEIIYSELEKEGFAANNIVFGAGSFSFNCIEENGILNPYTRDTYSIAIKATAGIVNGKWIPIFKDPKTDREAKNGGCAKKSQKGCCFVYKDADGKLAYVDECSEIRHKGSAMIPVYKNGEIVTEQKLSEIRNLLHDGNF